MRKSQCSRGVSSGGKRSTAVSRFNEVRRLLGRLELVALSGEDVVVEAAKNFRKLRSLGLTVRGTIDMVLATRCIVSGHRLLHSDRDFDAFEKHLGLRCIFFDA